MQSSYSLRHTALILTLAAFVMAGCKNSSGPEILDPDTAPKVTVDRFSNDAGTLHKRENNSSLPGPGEPVNFDNLFLVDGLGPAGQQVSYYDFDVMSREFAPIFVLFREGEDEPVEGQLNIINVVPGDPGYNDFWHVHRVTVPEDYVANTVTSLADIQDNGYDIQPTTMLVNCPVVPEGSTASQRFTDSEESGLIRGWYRDQVVFYFSFEEKQLSPTGDDRIPVSDIYVSFNINPGEEGGGPPSGFMTEANSSLTHNVVETVPTDNDYSPLWHVDIYDNGDFDMVGDLTSARNAHILAEGAALVNCPIVSVSDS